MAKTNYTRGEMKIDDHEETFSGFMGFSVYGAAMIVIALLLPILIFAVNLAWPTAMLVTVVLGVLIGVSMKFKAQWYAGLIGFAILLSVLIFILSIFL